MTVFSGIAAANETQASTRAWINVLTDIPIFAGLGRRQLRKLVEQARFAWFEPGEEVVTQEAPAHSLFVILSGEAKARGKRGARTLRQGDVFGEMSLIGERRSATVVATSELNVIVLSQPVARRLVESQPAIALKILDELGHRIQRLEQHAA